jgi:hypothetical protein
VAVLMEEDDSPDDGIEHGHQSLRAYIERRVNDFVVTLNLALIKAEAENRQAELGGDLLSRMVKVVNKKLDDLVNDISRQCQVDHHLGSTRCAYPWSLLGISRSR